MLHTSSETEIFETASDMPSLRSRSETTTPDYDIDRPASQNSDRPPSFEQAMEEILSEVEIQIITDGTQFCLTIQAALQTQHDMIIQIRDEHFDDRITDRAAINRQLAENLQSQTDHTNLRHQEQTTRINEIEQKILLLQERMDRLQVAFSQSQNNRAVL